MGYEDDAVTEKAAECSRANCGKAAVIYAGPENKPYCTSHAPKTVDVADDYEPQLK